MMVVAAVFVCSGFKINDDKKPNIADLHLNWQVMDNNYQNKNEALTALVITNKSHEVLPAGGWKIYFNSGRGFTKVAVSNNALIEQVNGDLYSISPTSGFKDLKPGETARIEFICDDPVVNITDAPEGPYLVWDNAPEKGYSFGSYDITPYKPTYQGLITPEIVYDRNKTVSDIPADQLVTVFPTPVSYHLTTGVDAGGYFSFREVLLLADEKFKNEKEILKKYLESVDKNVFKKSPLSSTIRILNIKYQEGISAEGYEIKVDSFGITISASTPAGAFYGVQSLKTMISPSVLANPKGGLKIPCVEVADAPRFAHRAVMLDVARNFQSKQQVLKLLEAMSLYKLNILHLHLTDDEGWRIEIPSLPELTSIGSKRGHTLDSKHHLPPSHGSGPEVDNPFGTGYYTKADYIEILKYANDRHITVVPEIETPGHARASIKAMNARYDRLAAEGKKAEAEKYLLYDQNDKSDYRSVQYWNDNVIDVSLPSTYNFVETVVSDLISTYKEAGAPLPTIHFGGDEVPANVWEKSPAYLALKATHPEIQGTNDLWYYFYGRVN
ncbi:MAG: beta-N-acetylhexosaminidase [Mucilaginibacter sp.]|nr:beta-N-acetylhexosaminidase [Mucilaginibacter sp.]